MRRINPRKTFDSTRIDSGLVRSDLSETGDIPKHVWAKKETKQTRIIIL